MNRIYLLLLAVLVIIMLSSWGFHAHKLINRMAVFALPTDIAGFYKHHADYITEHAIDADKRCYVDTAESPRHFIDVDDYGEQPFDSIPIHWTAAAGKFTERRLLASGILPWQINRSYHNLVTALGEKDFQRILRYSADIGHYLADAHVPLHTTSNYNGQLTNQVGIHAFWESRLPELFSDGYNFFVGRAHYIESPLNDAWRIVKESFSLVDSVLGIEAQLNERFPADRKYAYVERNRSLIRAYSEEYSLAYHEALQGMVERRLRASIISVGSFWYSAWVDAGQPDIRHLTKQTLTQDSLATPTPAQKILGREEWH
ncbi:zinc dependent phospholipase C family protein [Parapedobacter tibetensis]|uniref:zinc dependent phospholipase C family protein n=1 Tax=Parapedobacter tibetensis TaxID=2972951 RepID=UPI00214D3B49|nr:zinc dependent phospholipase C family protein [Parapedobacter tibetensis]